MNRDYAKRGASKQKAKKKSSYFGLWLFVLLLFIAFTATLVYLGKYKHGLYPKSSLLQKNTTIPRQQKILTEATIEVANKPKFDFYTISPQKRNNGVVSTYELAIASVKEYTVADHLKAELTLLGFAVNITPIRESNIEKYYVSVGPYNTEKDAVADLEKLKQNKIHSELKKLR